MSSEIDRFDLLGCCLEDKDRASRGEAQQRGVERLARFVKMRIDPSWDDETLAKRVANEIKPNHLSGMY
jgi:hypothetical protein